MDDQPGISRRENFCFPLLLSSFSCFIDLILSEKEEKERKNPAFNYCSFMTDRCCPELKPVFDSLVCNKAPAKLNCILSQHYMN